MGGKMQSLVPCTINNTVMHQRKKQQHLVRQNLELICVELSVVELLSEAVVFVCEGNHLKQAYPSPLHNIVERHLPRSLF